MGKVILHHKQLEVRGRRRHVEHLPRGLGEAGGRASVAPRSVHFLPASLLCARGLQGSLGKKVGGRELTAEMEFERVALGCRQSLGIKRKWAPASDLGERKGGASPSSRAPCPRSPAFPRVSPHRARRAPRSPRSRSGRRGTDPAARSRPGESFPRYSQPPSPSADGAKRPPPPIFPWGKRSLSSGA